MEKKITSSHISPGMIVSLNKKIYRVESCIKVSAPKGVPFMKTKLKNIMTDEPLEKNFKLDQKVIEVALSERRLEFLYPEGKNYLCLDIDNLEQVFVPQKVIGDKIDFLKEGTRLKALFYGDSIFSIELPQFLELIVAKTETDDHVSVSNTEKIAVLETGAKVEVPLFIEPGDIIKVDTQSSEYVQRI